MGFCCQEGWDWNSPSPCLKLPRAGIADIQHHAQTLNETFFFFLVVVVILGLELRALCLGMKCI
jgi:hypothetical protein